MKLINMMRRICLWFAIRNLTRELDDRREYLALPQSVDDYTFSLIRYDLTKTKLNMAIAEREALIRCDAHAALMGVKP